MRVALIHDWLTGMRGGEKALEELCGLFPQADIFTLLHVRGSVSREISKRSIKTSFVQRLPFAASKYRSYLPLFPTAIERFDLRGYDLVISSSHCVAKGVVPPPDAYHLCYCFTPMRYVWDMYADYFGPGKVQGLAKLSIPFFANYLRTWDAASSARVDRFVAISSHVRARIRKYYGREADIVFPPVNTAHTRLSEFDGGYFLVVSALVPYKRIELAVAAFNRLGEKLVVAGSGPGARRLKAMAGPNVSFTGWVGEERLRELYANCRALVFPGEEDFGMVPVEAQCWGKPVIAFGRGGALETVEGHWFDSADAPRSSCTGFFFREQTVDNIVDAVKAFSRWRPVPANIRAHALKFDAAEFRGAIMRLVERGERR